MEAMTLIKEDMAIFGHCPAHDEFYLVVCNHCSQVVKPQAFEKHCERRHGPLSKLFACMLPPPSSKTSSIHLKSRSRNSQLPSGMDHGASKPQKETPLNSSSKTPQPDRTAKGQRDSLCLFVPVVNLEKISGLPKADSDLMKVTSKLPAAASSTRPQAGNGKEALLKATAGTQPVTKPAPTPLAKPLTDLSVSTGGQNKKTDFSPSSVDQEQNRTKNGHKSYKKISRKECDLKRHCGVVNPDTKTACTRLLTCKIHSVHQRREVLGRPKDFDQLVSELKAASRNRELGREKTSSVKEPLAVPPSQDGLSLPSAGSEPLPFLSKGRLSDHSASRLCASSESDADETVTSRNELATGQLYYPFLSLRGSYTVSSDESEEESPLDTEKLDCHYSVHPPRPLAFCTFGSRVVNRGCYIFDRRLDRFCSALSTMLEKHRNSQVWRKVPAVPTVHSQHTSSSAPVPSPARASLHFGNAVSSLPSTSLRTSSSCLTSAAVAKGTKVHTVTSRALAAATSAHAAPACTLVESTGDGQSVTSPKSASTSSPSAKTNKALRMKEPASSHHSPSSRKRKKSPASSDDGSSRKKNCVLERARSNGSISTCLAQPSVSKASLRCPTNGAMASGPMSRPGERTDVRGKAGGFIKRAEHSESRGKAPPPGGCRGAVSKLKGVQLNCVSREEGKKRKSAPMESKTSRVVKSPSESSCWEKRKSVPSTGLERKLNTQKTKAHS
ncbi:ataxin-7-like protein 2a [Latimeria chalumnae]|uniref:ataxin-7-like protein 2a n=1 Tax=Latimeria chalumnae TaxID=7897 RepID=UPI00313AA331